MKTTIPLVALLVLLACGSSSSNGPSAPTPSLNLAGTWTGTWQYVTSGVTVVDAVTATLTQNGADVSGTWTAESGASGQFQHLSAQASTSGAITISLPTVTGTTCAATSTVSGSASTSTLQLAVAPIAANGVCQWATAQQFSLGK